MPQTMKKGIMILYYLTKKFLHLLYNQLYWAYDLVAYIVSAGKWNYWILESLAYIKGYSVLEIGIGTGHLQVALAKKGYLIYAQDISFNMANISKNRLIRHNCPSNVICADNSFIPLTNSSIDVVIATFPTEYILDKKTLNEIFMILRPGGELIILLNTLKAGNSLIHMVNLRIWKFFEHVKNTDTILLQELKSTRFHVKEIEHKYDNSILYFIKATKLDLNR